MSKGRRLRSWISLSLLLMMLIVWGCLGRSANLWFSAWVGDKPQRDDLPAGSVDDASRLNQTHVAEVWSIPADQAAAELQLRDLLERARNSKTTVAVAGARHSMGGHTITPNGIIVDMLPFRHMHLDAEKRLLLVGAGARSRDVIPFLEARGFSVAIMQAFNDFSIGGSISVNCHGWQHDLPPLASTVESFRLMKADGSIVRCSRDENAELFRLVIGGYGLFGVILEAELRVVPNERYRPEMEIVTADEYVSRFDVKTKGASDIGMAYGRLCVVPGEKTFLREAIFTVFRKAPCAKNEIPVLGTLPYQSLRRAVYRAQIGSQAGKEVRWNTEKKWGEQFTTKFFSRNQLLDDAVETYQEQNTDRTDILQEYFIPPPQVVPFLARAREAIPKHRGDLLNVTIRTVREDKDSLLRYADQDQFAFVMLFNQRRTPEADRQMELLTQELIDDALVCGGCYYLPYRLHATPAQFLRAYPQSPIFFAKKQEYDPQALFQNQFSRKYGPPNITRAK